jgi:hypothetical protein
MIVINNGEKNPRAGELKKWKDVRRTANGMVGWDTQRIQTPNLLFWTNWREIHTTQFATMLLPIPALVPTLSNGCIRAKENPTINT